MQLKTILAHAYLIIFAVALPAIDPATVTSFSPEQESAISDAVNSLLESATNDPLFTSALMDIMTAPAAISALSSFEAGPLPTGTEALAEMNSIINLLPSNAQSFFRSITSAEGSIMSSVLNEDTPTTVEESVTQITDIVTDSTTVIEDEPTDITMETVEPTMTSDEFEPTDIPTDIPAPATSSDGDEFTEIPSASSEEVEITDTPTDTLVPTNGDQLTGTSEMATEPTSRGRITTVPASLTPATTIQAPQVSTTMTAIAALAKVEGAGVVLGVFLGFLVLL